MSSFSKLKQNEVWVSILVGYLDSDLRFYRVLLALIGVYFYLIIEIGNRQAIVIQFDLEEDAKKWAEKYLLNNNVQDTNPFWTHFYAPYATWLEEEFDINSSNLIDKQLALSTLNQVKQERGELRRAAFGHLELEVRRTMDQ